MNLNAGSWWFTCPCSHGSAVDSSRNPELPQWGGEGSSGKGAGPRKPDDQTSVPRTHEQLNLGIHICHRSTLEGEGRQRGESHLRACRPASLVYAVKQQKNKGPKFTPTRWKEKTNSPRLISHLHTHCRTLNSWMDKNTGCKYVMEWSQTYKEN